MGRSIVVAIGRIFLAGIFLLSAVYEVIDFNTTREYFLFCSTRLMNGVEACESLAAVFSFLFPFFSWVLMFAIGMKIVGSLLVMIGVYVRFGAFLLSLFIIGASIVIHGFWWMPIEQQPLEVVMFMKNMSILGGLLILLAYGKKSQ